MITKISRYWNTLKYLRPEQFVHRANFVLKRKLVYKYNINNRYYLNKVNALDTNELKIERLFSNNDSISLNEQEIVNLKKSFTSYEMRQFTFLNNTIKFDKDLGWHDGNIQQLWRYNLHYFDYAREIGIYHLNESESNKSYILYKKIVESWVSNNNHIGVGDGWHPYTVSLRLVNWIFAYYLFYEKIEEDSTFREEYTKSIYLQSLYLLKNLEYDVYGNHLFENAKTLIFAGMFFSEIEFGDRLLKRGQKIMASELKEQILADGGHFELSPMYHSIVFKGLSELIQIYRKKGINIPGVFTDTQEKMVGFLKNMIHPDDDIPLFNDSAFGVSDSPQYLFEYVKGEAKAESALTPFDRLISTSPGTIKIKDASDIFIAKESGYLVSKDKKSNIVLDFGKPCPEYLPAHAHADIFSYELSFNEERLITDTGTYEYAPGEWRNFNRSTRAHNTVTYKDRDQSEVWGSFRVAERAKVRRTKIINNSSIVKFSGSHDGYFKKYGVTHDRTVLHIKDRVIIILDIIEGKNDLLAEDIKSYIHLNPEATFRDNQIITEKNSILVQPLMNTKLNTVEKGNKELLQGWYSPEFGKKMPRETLIYSPVNEISRHHVFGYAYLLDSQFKLESKQINNTVKFTLSSKRITEIYNIDLGNDRIECE